MDSSSLGSAMNVASSALAIPLYISPEEAALGQAVFHNFLHEEFEQEGIDDEDILIEEDIQAQGDVQLVAESFQEAQNLVINNQNINHAIQFQQFGELIRQYANEFARSPQRQAIRGHADEVDLAAINHDNFWHLLDEVFRNGVTSANLIALFFFCSDVLIRCARQGLKSVGLYLFRWAVQYIVEKVCKWVHDRGGWEKALRDAYDNTYIRYAAFGVLAVTISWLAYRGIKN